ncbi:MAG: cytochrome c oxidase subunit II [Flavobacteriaceae bacterium]|nr:cytochrome c oxidase subunit II [Flavobacteriaceae bacterium]
MTGLLIFFVLVLIGIAIWQLTKIFALTQIGASENTEVANDNDNKVNGYLMFAFVGFIYLFTIYSIVKWGHLVLGTPASEHGPDYDNLMNISFVIIFIVQTLTQFLLHYFAFKYSGKKDQKAMYYADNNKLEAIWTGIPVVVLAGLILYGLYTWNNIMYFDAEEDVLYVEVYAKQFGWEVRYSGEDNTLGKANVRYIEGVNTLGVDLSDPAAQDDKVTNELHLPKGKKVVFKFRSQDVLHSAYMPHFRAQMNCVPGMITQFTFVPTVTTSEMRQNEAIQKKVANINKIRTEKSKELIANGESALDPYEFNYLLLCNKICGASHYNMQMKIVVEEKDEFTKWLAEKPTLSTQWAEANKPAETPAQQEVIEVVADTTKVVAQVIE